MPKDADDATEYHREKYNGDELRAREIAREEREAKIAAELAEEYGYESQQTK